VKPASRYKLIAKFLAIAQMWGREPIQPGDVIVIDRASFHHAQSIEELVAEAGCELWYLPPYSPDLNLIERWWFVLKNWIKQRWDEFDNFRDCVDAAFRSCPNMSSERLTRLVLLIAIAYSFSTLKGKAIKSIGQQKYLSRLRKIQQTLTKNSNFWIGLSGDVWVITREFVAQWVEQLMRVSLNKLPFYQKGIKAMTMIQQVLWLCCHPVRFKSH
jgi:hypothetical protein